MRTTTSPAVPAATVIVPSYRSIEPSGLSRYSAASTIETVPPPVSAIWVSPARWSVRTPVSGRASLVLNNSWLAASGALSARPEAPTSSSRAARARDFEVEMVRMWVM